MAYHADGYWYPASTLTTPSNNGYTVYLLGQRTDVTTCTWTIIMADGEHPNAAISNQFVFPLWWLPWDAGNDVLDITARQKMHSNFMSVEGTA